MTIHMPPLTAPRKKPPSTPPIKRGLIGKIHVAKKQLGLEDDTYRDLLVRETGKDSTKGMSIAELEAVSRAMVNAGFQPTAPRRAGRRKMASSEAAAKIRALWLAGYHLGVVQDPSEKALSSWVKRVTGGRDRGLEALQWLTEADAEKAMEGLKAWLAREAKVNWGAYHDPITGRPIGTFPKRRVVEAQAALLGLGKEQLGEIAYAVTRRPALGWCEDGDLDALIEHLGGAVRSRGVE